MPCHTDYVPNFFMQRLMQGFVQSIGRFWAAAMLPVNLRPPSKTPDDAGLLLWHSAASSSYYVMLCFASLARALRPLAWLAVRSEFSD